MQHCVFEELAARAGHAVILVVQGVQESAQWHRRPHVRPTLTCRRARGGSNFDKRRQTIQLRIVELTPGRHGHVTGDLGYG